MEIVLNSLGRDIGKSSVYWAVQAVARQVPGMQQEHLLDGYQTKAVGADMTSMRCNGKWLPVGIAVDATNEMALSIDELSGEEAEHQQPWLEPILKATESQFFHLLHFVGSN